VERTSGQLPVWKEQVAAEITHAAALLDELATTERRWSRTRDRPETAQAGDAITTRVDSSLALLASAIADQKAWQRRLLTLEHRLLYHNTTVADALATLEEAARAEGASLMVANHPPLWRRGLTARLADEWPQVPQRLAAFQRSTRDYIASDARPARAR